MGNNQGLPHITEEAGGNCPEVNYQEIEEGVFQSLSNPAEILYVHDHPMMAQAAPEQIAPAELVEEVRRMSKVSHMSAQPAPRTSQNQEVQMSQEQTVLRPKSVARVEQPAAEKEDEPKEKSKKEKKS